MTWKNILKISTEEAIQDAERYADSEDTEIYKSFTSGDVHRGMRITLNYIRNLIKKFKGINEKEPRELVMLLENLEKETLTLDNKFEELDRFFQEHNDSLMAIYYTRIFGKPMTTEEAEEMRNRKSTNTEMEKVGVAVTTSSVAHTGLFRPTFGGRRRKRKKKED